MDNAPFAGKGRDEAGEVQVPLSMRTAVTVLVVCVAGLLALGMVTLYSASMTQYGARYLVTQATWLGIGFVACVVAAAIDYRNLKKLALPILIVCVALLVAVLTHGKWVKGARRWLYFGSFGCQPSEFAKLALILFLAYYVDRFQRKMPTFWRGVALPGLFIGLTLGLIFVEPDRGTAILMAVVCGVMLVIAGVRWPYVVACGLVVAAGLAYSLSHDSMRSGRIYSWLHLEETKLGKGMQAYQAMLALGSGGVAGVGLGDGMQKHGFVPEHYTDFIFSMIGEELGLAATLSVVLAFLGVLICGIYIARRARDAFGLMLAAGVSFLICLQAWINIGVVTSALPNKGLPLPFISYGGSNLVAMLTGIGLVISVARKATPGSAVAFETSGLSELPLGQTP